MWILVMDLQLKWSIGSVILADMLSVDGSTDMDVTASIQRGWNKFIVLYSFLTVKVPPLD